MKHLYLFLIFLFSNSLLFSQNFEQITALVSPVGNNRDITSADIDNDGDKDMIVATGGKTAWFSNDGMGVFNSIPFSVSPLSQSNAVKARDMDGDGDLDFLIANGSSTANSNIAWIPNSDGAGTFGSAKIITLQTNEPRDVDAGDLDGDGDPDVVYAGYGDAKFRWSRNLGNGSSWGAPLTLGSNATAAKLVKIFDLDNDNDNDIITLVFANSSFPKIAWYKNDGAGNFLPDIIAGFDDNLPFDFTIGDINGDNLPDIVVSYYTNKAIYWFQNNGDGTFLNKSLIIDNFSGAGSVLLNDFDLDGDLDLICPNTTTAKIKLFRNTGNGTFLTPVTLNTTHDFGAVTSSGTHYMISDDFNNDGRMDFAAIINTSKTINWFKNNPLTPFDITMSGTSSVSCHGADDGIIKIAVNGGAPAYTFAWNLPGLSGDSINNLAAGTYIVTVTDAFSSSVVDTFTIANPAAIQLDFTTTLAYPEYGSATVIPSGGIPPYTCEWSNGDTSLVATNLLEGVYVCTVTDMNGCTQEGSAYVETLPVIQFLLVNMHYITCFGGSDGGVELLVIETLPPYTFLWNNGDTTRILQNVPVGEYTCTITDNLGGTATVSVAFLGPLPISFNYTATQPTNNQANGAISIIDVSGGQGAPYTYLWNTGATSVAIAGLTSGIYTCTVTDHKGCTYAETIILDDATSVLNPEWKSQISISPNPAQDQCSIEWNVTEPMANIHLYNNLGILVFQDAIRQSNTYSFCTANYPPGIYQIGLISASGKMIFRPLVIGE